MKVPRHEPVLSSILYLPYPRRNHSPSKISDGTCSTVSSPIYSSIHDLAHLATELTCQVASLGSIWLLAIKTLSTCAPPNRSTSAPNHPNAFDELRRMDSHDLHTHDNLSVFISIMIARHALSINDYIIVSVQSIIGSTPKERLDPSGSRPPPLSRMRGSSGEEANEPGTRFTCDVIEHLLCANHIPWTMMIASRERRLLASNYRMVAFGAFLCVLKSLLIISQSCFKDCKIYYDLCRESTQRHKDNDRNENALNMDVNSQAEREFLPSREPMPEELVDLSMRVLKLCCDQDWIQERCLKESDTLCNQTNLCDKLLDDGQAQQLLRFICYKSTSDLTRVSFDKGPKPIISSLLQNLNQWTLRATILELKLMIKILEYNIPLARPQDPNFNYSLALKSHEHNTQHLLLSIASATIELFQQQTEGRYAGAAVATASSSAAAAAALLQANEQEDRKGIWLIAPLISRLPDNVQSKILQIAGKHRASLSLCEVHSLSLACRKCSREWQFNVEFIEEQKRQGKSSPTQHLPSQPSTVLIAGSIVSQRSGRSTHGSARLVARSTRADVQTGESSRSQKSFTWIILGLRALFNAGKESLQ